MNNTPFFIVGSVLSGTTLLRNVLRLHPRLLCPEETHVFRWGTPFATEEFVDLYNNADTLKLHRKIDGIQEQEFREVLSGSVDRHSFMLEYFEAFKRVKNKKQLRCFDKSPQNVYGMVLIKAYFPKAKFIHIIRNPLDVVASIMRGHPGLSSNVLGAINYWKEAVLILKTLKHVWKDDIIEIKYENFCEKPQCVLNDLMDFLQEDLLLSEELKTMINKPSADNLTVLTDKDKSMVRMHLSDLSKSYGYNI